VSAYAHIGTPEGMMGIARSVENMGLNNFGGIMFWDGPEGMLNLEGGQDIISWAKEGLNGSRFG
jgi:chitinase